MAVARKSRSRPIVALSIGCPSGIGPEVAVVAAARSPEARCLLVGDPAVTRRAAEVVMAFAAEKLTTALVTTHLPLAAVPAAITPEAVATTTYWIARLCRALGARGARARIAVAALNPHAGEGGLLGDEEITR